MGRFAAAEKGIARRVLEHEAEADAARAADGTTPVLPRPKRGTPDPAKIMRLSVRLVRADLAAIKIIEAETGMKAQEQVEEALALWFAERERGEPVTRRMRREGTFGMEVVRRANRRK